MHSYFTWQTQPPIYTQLLDVRGRDGLELQPGAGARPPAQAATTTRDFQIAVIEEAMANFHRYFFIMPTWPRSSWRCHERVERGEGLTADGMSAKMAELYREGYGAEVEMDETRVGITWAQFPHLFGNFYVYQYATGISAANALADGVLAKARPRRSATRLPQGGRLALSRSTRSSWRAST